MSNTELTLVYFNARGLAETSRILLALAQVDYTDQRYPLEVIDPINHIYVKEQFEKDKKEGFYKKSMGKLPILIVNEPDIFSTTIIPQSKSIERYISKKYGLMGNGLLEEAKIDGVCECIRDIKDRYQKIRTGTDQEKSEYFSKTIREELLNLVEVFDTEGAKYAVGSKLSLADVSVYYLVSQFYDNKEVVNVAADIPRIRDIVIRVASRPEVRVYLADRVQTPF
jgi:glutathione S-transferase